MKKTSLVLIQYNFVWKTPKKTLQFLELRITFNVPWREEREWIIFLTQNSMYLPNLWFYCQLSDFSKGRQRRFGMGINFSVSYIPLVIFGLNRNRVQKWLVRYYSIFQFMKYLSDEKQCLMAGVDDQNQ